MLNYWCRFKKFDLVQTVLRGDVPLATLRRRQAAAQNRRSDDLLLELAVAAGSRYIITHNLRDFRGSEKWGIAAISPGDFLRLIEKTT